MKLSDFKGEQAIDVLAQIMTPASHIISDEKFKKMVKDGNTYLAIAVYILQNHKEDILDMYEPLTQEDKTEATPIKLVGMIMDIVQDTALNVKLVGMIMDIVQDTALNDLFTSQGQNGTSTPSGSAMENTVDGLK